MKKYFKYLFLFCISLVFLSGCMSELMVPSNDLNSVITEIATTVENTEGGSGTAKGTLKIYLTNSEGNYKKPPVNFLEDLQGPPVFVNPVEEYLAVNISISRIEGHIASDEEEGEDGYWEILKEWYSGYDINLMDIQNVSVLLASLNLEPNTYTQLRIFFEKDAELVLLRDGSEVTEELKIPSSDQTGIKLNHPFEIVAGNITKLIIEFDAEQSVIKTGSGKYLMKPVIRLSSETYSLGDDLTDLEGSVSGTVSRYVSNDGALTLEGIDGAEIELTGGAYLFDTTTTTTLQDGSFSLLNVPKGTYTLNVYSVFGDYSEDNVVVTVGEDTSVDIVLLSGGISGIVKEEGSDPTIFINGATVTVDLTGGETFNSSGITDENGEFIIETLPVGFYNLMISATGYETYNDTGETIQVIAGAITDVSEIGLKSR